MQGQCEILYNTLKSNELILNSKQILCHITHSHQILFKTKINMCANIDLLIHLLLSRCSQYNPHYNTLRSKDLM